MKKYIIAQTFDEAVSRMIALYNEKSAEFPCTFDEEDNIQMSMSKGQLTHIWIHNGDFRLSLEHIIEHAQVVGWRITGYKWVVLKGWQGYELIESNKE